jgi:hypothetical protein
MSELGQNCKSFLAVFGGNLAVFGGILADVGQKVAVTFQHFCGFEGHALSYIKKEI